MLSVTLTGKKKQELKILFLGAHCDDIEIGCGGTALRLLNQFDNTSVKWVVFSARQERKREAVASARVFLKSAVEKDISIMDFRDGFFPYSGMEIKESFERMKSEFLPDLIFTHYRGDSHQDHRLINELTWNTYRDHFILEYEIPKYDGDLGSPNFFVRLESETCKAKIETIQRYFKSQADKHWFTADTFWSIMRLRGIEINSSSKYAEGFYCQKASL